MCVGNYKINQIYKDETYYVTVKEDPGIMPLRQALD